MDKKLYDQWIKYLFDHDEAKSDWRWDIDIEPVEVPSKIFPDFVIQFHEDLPNLIKTYTVWQLAMGIDVIFNANVADYVFDWRDGEASLEKKTEAILSMKKLYSECFFKLCRPRLGHLSEDMNELENFCYMIWDVSPLSYCENNDQKDRFYKVIAEVMEYALSLNNIACKESALHGLGHLISPPYYPEAKDIIQNFIDKNKNADHRIIAYAQNAKTGCIQ